MFLWDQASFPSSEASFLIPAPSTELLNLNFLQYEFKSDKSNASIDGGLHKFQADSFSFLLSLLLPKL